MKKIFLKKRKKIFVGKNKIEKERNEIKNQKETTISFIKEKYPFLPNNENMLDNYNFIQYNNFKLPRIPFDNFYKINFDELFKKINLDNSFSKNYICNIQNNNDIKKHPHSYQISPLTPNNTIENIFDKSEIIIDIKNDDIEEKKFESNNNLLNISNNSNSNFIDINNITKIESKKKKYKSKRNIFKLYDKNKKLICKKRGKKPLSKRKSNIHTAEDEDNILRKIQVHFLTFLVSFTNDYLDTIYSNVKKKYIPHFKDIDYTIKRIISHDSIEKMKVLTIGEILQKRASPKNKSCDNNNINKEIYNIGNNKSPYFDNKKCGDGLVGLQNLGATCFMNSTLQLFSNITELKDYLYNKDYMSDLEKIQSKGNITKSLGFVIENLWSSNSYYSFAPSQFKSIIGYYNPKFLRNEPNDSRELIQYIIDSLHEELNINKGREYTEDEDDNMNLEKQFKYEKDSFEYENNSIISKLFYGIQGIETKCLKCNNKFYSFDHFSILSLPILETINRAIELTEMLKNFEEEIKMTGDNKFYCTECNKEREAITKTFLYELPKYLIIHPARTNRGLRYTIDIKFEENLKLGKYVHSNYGHKLNINYRLIGIISHFGSSGFGGHNIAYCNRNGKWYEFNDSKVYRIDFNEISGSTVLILVYKNDN